MQPGSTYTLVDLLRIHPVSPPEQTDASSSSSSCGEDFGCFLVVQHFVVVVVVVVAVSVAQLGVADSAGIRAQDHRRVAQNCAVLSGVQQRAPRSDLSDDRWRVQKLHLLGRAD